MHHKSILVPLVFVFGCSGDPGTEEPLADSEVAEALSAGVNGEACLHSPFNCKLRASGGNRVEAPGGGQDWAVGPGTVRDGAGGAMIADTNGGSIAVNYGQIRHFAGQTLVMAMSTANGSAGWYPIDAVKEESTLRARIGNVDAKDPGRGKLGCYQIRNSDDEKLAAKKVVKDATDSHERAGDYLPLVRKNGRRYANLAFSVPGDALGAPSVDIYPAGTKFQRVDVPTSSGSPHLTVRLYSLASDGHYTKPAGTMTFVYGYAMGAEGTKRFGWIPLDALTASSGCR
jgi:hypothetical protein